jgi:hypothetical protein
MKLSTHIALVAAMLTSLTILPASALASPVGGALSTVDRVEPRTTDTYRNIKLRADEVTIVKVRGDGDTDLDLYVYDQNDNLIAKDTDYTDQCVVRLTPKWTGGFTIKIVNRGRVYNKYRLDVY